MNLTKILMTILVLTVLASLQVHQQTRIIQLAYQEQEKLAYLRSLLDENKNLKYRINQQTSLVSIAKICPLEEFEWPYGKQLVSLPISQGSIEKNTQRSESTSMLSNLFRLKSQAEATPVKPR